MKTREGIIIGLFLISLIFILSSCTSLPSEVSQDRKIVTACKYDSDCKWVSTNCCPESGGAYWECINKDMSTISCPEGSGCRLFISEKPTKSCVCIDNLCQSA